MAVATEAPTGAQMEEVAPTVATAGMATPTAASEAEEALEVVTTLDVAEPPARGAAGRGATPRVTATEVTGDTRREAPRELVALAPRRTKARTPTSLS